MVFDPIIIVQPSGPRTRMTFRLASDINDLFAPLSLLWHESISREEQSCTGCAPIRRLGIPETKLSSQNNGGSKGVSRENEDKIE